MLPTGTDIFLDACVLVKGKNPRKVWSVRRVTRTNTVEERIRNYMGFEVLSVKWIRPSSLWPHGRCNYHSCVLVFFEFAESCSHTRLVQMKVNMRVSRGSFSCVANVDQLCWPRGLSRRFPVLPDIVLRNSVCP